MSVFPYLSEMLFGGFFLLLLAGFGAAAWFFIRKYQREKALMQKGVPVRGRVLQISEMYSDTGRVGCQIQVCYYDRYGFLRQKSIPTYYNYFKGQVWPVPGGEVELVMDPQHPDRVHLKGYNTTGLTTVILAVGLPLCGALVLFIGVSFVQLFF